ncbi:Telomere repeat-binding protein 2 [Cardamine amara subsp. amara]|uniref:Telomere repeat-binding protein 2 n=1 Tax=Cardamine amara subsp. amara TaxID=228776 RepID=A0ABD0Z0I5_CARAN
MVSHKVLEFGDNGYKFPAQARAPRSVRKRRVYKKKISGDDTMCAIDLLATVAGSLLLENESSVIAGEDKCVVVQNTVKMEVLAVENPVKSVPVSEDNPCEGSPSPCGFSSVITNPNHLLVGDKVENEVEGFTNLGGSDSCEVRNFSKGLSAGGNGDVKPDVVVSIGSNSSTEVGACGNDGPNGSRDDVNLFSRDDDDENFSGYIRPRMTRPVPRIGDRRIRKILASRHWKGGSRNSADAKPWYCSKRSYYLHHHQRSYPIKKRKYFDNISDSNSDDYRMQAKTRKGNRIISSMKSRNASFVSRDHHVRLRIKSFRVPELFIEIPETATVGSLKRTVMEAVTTILGDGLRVGLMVQGKKVRDDSKTLLQSGISEENTHLDSLGFSLEPSLETTTQPLLSSYLSEHACDDLTLCRDNVLDSNNDSAPSPEDSFGKLCTTDDSRALVPIASTAVLACQAPNRKFKRIEQQQAAHRRIRRPFSVTEVEALVQAVEKLGTGRWRDIKVRAFEDADHRTYVDLKDKWKTLVHTARISPQQRRGEPVPQELLDRVLKAHAYWSQHLMHQLQTEPPLSLGEALI